MEVRRLTNPKKVRVSVSKFIEKLKNSEGLKVFEFVT